MSQQRKIVFLASCAVVAAAACSLIGATRPPGPTQPPGPTPEITESAVPPSSSYTLPAGPVTVAAGYESTCSVLADHTVSCWGPHNGEDANDPTYLPVGVPGISNAIAVDTSGFHTCALLADRTIRCWGSNGWGELGDGSRQETNSPVAVKGISSAIAVATGYWHTCALLADGTVRCWGENHSGQLGFGGETYWSVEPVAVPNIADAVSITAGDRDTCVVRRDGSIWCWGTLSGIPLGDGRVGHGPPVAIGGLPPAVSVDLNDGEICAVVTGGAVWCVGGWRWDEASSTWSTQNSGPEPIPGINGAIAVTVGDRFACAVLSMGAVECWGYNIDGQLGDGTSVPFKQNPTFVVGFQDATDISAGQAHVCAVRAESTVTCWGTNWDGQLGNGHLDPSPVRPTPGRS